MNLKIKVFFLGLFFSHSLFSQTLESSEVKCGFKTIESVKEMSTSDYEKIQQTNFDQYRFFNIRQKVQIVRGPLIELLSVNEMQKQGADFSKEYVDMVKTKSEAFKHETIVNLDLGLGTYPAYEPK
ncbi:MAG: hypothetical protein HY062_15415 [Bacteroidetes bacterium]|nr:hypothetical protein [Bacteroidota bacterium]